MLRRLMRSLFSEVDCDIDHLKPYSIEQASYILNEFGLVILPKELLKKELEIDWNSLEHEIEKMNNTLSSDIGTISHDICGEIRFGVLNPIQASDDAKNSKTFIHERGAFFYDKHMRQWCDIDNGIVDIFNILPYLKNYPELYRFTESINNLSRLIINRIGLYSIDDDLSYINAYIYKSVNSPRCLHIDSHSIQFKVFFPTCNIRSIEKGPISYIPHSHRSTKRLRAQVSTIINRIFGSDLGSSNNDATFFGNQEALPILTNLGDIVIANQTCVHGDLPYKGFPTESEPCQKIVLVGNLFQSKMRQI